MVIVYNSKAGHTKEYAVELSKKLDLPLYNLTELKMNVRKGDEIIFCDWVMGGMLPKYAKIMKYNVCAICVVGSTKKDSEDMEKMLNKIKETYKMSCHMFYLEGGLEISKLKGFSKLLISLKEKSMNKKSDENKSFDVSKNKVDLNSLDPIVEWYKQRLEI